MIDASFHQGKDHEIKLTKSFLMGGLQYHVLKTQGSKKFVPMLRVLTGIYHANEMFSSSFTKSSFVFGWGLNGNLFLSQALYLSFLSDLFLISIDGGLRFHPRISAGIRFRTGCK